MAHAGDGSYRRWWLEVVEGGSGLEVGVAEGFLVGVGVWWRDEPGCAGADVDAPVFLVDQVVMPAA